MSSRISYESLLLEVLKAKKEKEKGKKEEPKKEETKREEAKDETKKERNPYVSPVNCSEIWVDGCCNPLTGDGAWASVVNQNKVDLLSIFKDDPYLSDMNIQRVSLPGGISHYVAVTKFNDVKSQQNNGAELVSLVIGLRIIKERELTTKVIYSDSQVVAKFWSNPTWTLKNTKLDPKKVEYIKESSKLRKEFESNGGKVIQISGDINKADLGFHKK